MDGKSVAVRLSELRNQIAVAEKRAGRSPGCVQLVAVSKTKSVELVSEAAAAGQRMFAENYVQEALGKVAVFPSLQWHFIGSLQTNKVKDVVGRFALIHSVDRERLLCAISDQAQQQNIIQDCLLQIHIGSESTKHGFDPTEVQTLVRTAKELRGIRLRGLMCLPPVTTDESVGRGFFRELRELSVGLRGELKSEFERAAFDLLSMGTSGDFEWAILEGATHIRIGTSIFGERERK